MKTIEFNDVLSVSFSEFRSIKRLKIAWEHIIDPDEGKIYLTWAYNHSCCCLFRLQQMLIHLKNKNAEKQHIVFFVAKNSVKQIIFIFPAIINSSKKTICWLGAQYSSGSGYNDYVCMAEYHTVDIWKLFLNYLKQNYSGYMISLHDIEESCIIEGKKKERACVKIVLKPQMKEHNSVFEDWYSSLSKSVRQNIRTAYNRINTDEKKFLYFEKNIFLLRRNSIIIYCIVNGLHR